MSNEVTPNLMDPAYVANPYPALNALREREPVGPDATGAQVYLTRYEDVHQALFDRSLSSDPRLAAPGTSGWFIAQGMDPESDENISMLFRDEPGHTRLRKLVNKAFTPRAVEVFRPRARAIADGLLDNVNGESEFDVMAAFCQPYPTIVIAEMLGVDRAQQENFKAWSDLLVQQLNPFLTPEQRAAIEEADRALNDYFATAIAERRLHPTDDLMSRLITAQEDGDSLTDSEMHVMLSLLLVAGNVTTTDLVGNGIHALLSHPDQLQKLRDDPSLIPNAIEEVLRYDPPVLETGRFSNAEQQFSGCPVAAHQTIAPSLASANHDPRRFPDPEKFDVAREEIDHVSFGGGIHYCLGSALARLEGQVAVAALLERFPILRMAPGRAPVYRTMPGFRGLQSLWVAV